ncbi:penicillin-binding protein, 1A family [Syntrophus gentianae]|uniref:Penicillin-binding protein, 1A family n=1 Tax=Syntrophus gentianae TaxID=43775 RepID=A0A1H7UCJ4_9BACT|nr:PBP1A family penicillin-binding protein [Syntrophus gentianae]SEL94539.1 penicillin-binding protein, 1A family [Syntrophus gentianae]
MVFFFFKACKKWFLLTFLGFFLASGLASPAEGAEKLAAYPALPSNYSSIKIFDSKGQFVGRILPRERYWVSIDRINPFLLKAVVAIEDSRFYDHPGIDIRGIARALVKDVAKGKLAEGGSTITQQLIKNKYLSGQKTLDRKIKEGLLAMEYERKYSKNQILEMYLNEIYYGNGAWGIAQAARIFFDKSPRDLTEAECALLAGVPKAPNRYNPFGSSSVVRNRRNLVLSRMAELEMISPQKKQKLMAAAVSPIKKGEAPYYVDAIRNKLVERYGAEIIERGGLEVISAMDLALQRRAEQVLREGVRKISPTLQGALLCLDPNTGDVLAVAGGVDFSSSPYNRAFYAKRQPGSAIKPFIYAAALEKRYTASSIWNDAPVTYTWGTNESWTPQNYGNERYGEISLRQALAHSDNVIAVRLLDTIGVSYFIDFAGKLGLPLRAHNLSLALGTEEVTLTDLVEAYTPLANGGSRSEARTILRIYDRYHNAWTENPSVVTPVLSPATAFVTTSMMKDVLTYGTAKTLKKFSLERPSAGKTGTTDNYQDAWFIGYTPQVITGIWVGHDKPVSGGKGFTGGSVCAPIWGRFMRSALAAKPVLDFPKPETVVSVSIDPATGRLATPDCPEKKEEFYLAGTEPTEPCPQHGGGPLPSPDPTPPPPPDGEAPQPIDTPKGP